MKTECLCFPNISMPLSGFYLGIFVYGGSLGEGTDWGEAEKFEFHITRDTI